MLTPYLQHLLELRKRLLRSLTLMTVVFICLLGFSNHLFSLLAEPLLNIMPHKQGLIATNIATPLITPLKWTCYVSLFISMPYVFYQFWLFIAPGLYKTERHFMRLVVLLSTGLFYGGMLFAYYVVFPLIFRFFITVAPLGVTVMPDINEYLSFTLRLLFAFGLAFQVPVAILLLLRTGLCTEQSLRKARPYVIVIAFIVGMVLTPPDVLSQILLAIPICLLFELGLLLTRITPSHGNHSEPQNPDRASNHH